MNLYLEVSEDRERFPVFVVFFGCSGCGGRLRILPPFVPSALRSAGPEPRFPFILRIRP